MSLDRDNILIKVKDINNKMNNLIYYMDNSKDAKDLSIYTRLDDITDALITLRSTIYYDMKHKFK